MSYSLTSYNPMEGWRASFIGSIGRLEAEQFSSGPFQKEVVNNIRMISSDDEQTSPKPTGTHAGGDERLRRMIFVGDVEDPLKQNAESWAGAMSLLIGAGANVSIAEQRPVDVLELLK